MIRLIKKVGHSLLSPLRHAFAPVAVATYATLSFSLPPASFANATATDAEILATMKTHTHNVPVGFISSRDYGEVMNRAKANRTKLSPSETRQAFVHDITEHSADIFGDAALRASFVQTLAKMPDYKVENLVYNYSGNVRPQCLVYDFDETPLRVIVIPDPKNPLKATAYDEHYLDDLLLIDGLQAALGPDMSKRICRFLLGHEIAHSGDTRKVPLRGEQPTKATYHSIDTAENEAESLADTTSLIDDAKTAEDTKLLEIIMNLRTVFCALGVASHGTEYALNGALHELDPQKPLEPALTHAQLNEAATLMWGEGETNFMSAPTSLRLSKKDKAAIAQRMQKLNHLIEGHYTAEEAPLKENRNVQTLLHAAEKSLLFFHDIARKNKLHPLVPAPKTTPATRYDKRM